MSQLLNDPTHWRSRAEKTKAKANGYRLSSSEKEKLLRVAAEYDRIADRAEQCQADSEAEQQDIGAARIEEATA